MKHIKFDVRLPLRNNARGIYLRSSRDLNSPMIESVHISPSFPPKFDNLAKVYFSFSFLSF